MPSSGHQSIVRHALAPFLFNSAMKYCFAVAKSTSRHAPCFAVTSVQNIMPSLQAASQSSEVELHQVKKFVTKIRIDLACRQYEQGNRSKRLYKRYTKGIIEPDQRNLFTNFAQTEKNIFKKPRSILLSQPVWTSPAWPCMSIHSIISVSSSGP